MVVQPCLGRCKTQDSPLFIDGATVRTFSQSMQGGATCSAYIGGSIVTEMAMKRKSPVKQQKRITDVVLHTDTEEKIERHADPTERNHVRHPIDDIGLLADIIYDGYENDKQSPHSDEEEHDDPRLTERVESWIEKEFLPHLRLEILNTAIECCQSAHAHTEKCGIETADIVEMDNQEMFPTETLDNEKDESQAKAGKEKEYARVGKMVYKPRNPIVGNRPFKKRPLMYPPHRHLVARHHHPYTVLHISRDDGNVRHHHLIVGFESYAVGHKDACHLSRKTGFKRDGIGSYKIEILPKMMLLTKSDGINAGSMPEFGALGTVAMAGHHGTYSK